MKEFKFKIDGKSYTTSVSEKEGNMAEVIVNGKTYNVELEKEEKKARPISRPVSKAAPTATPQPTATASKPAGGAKSVKSPLPGSVVSVSVTVGQSVKKGDLLLTIESMKMENAIKAPRDGNVTAVYVQGGKSVLQGDALVDLE